ncbi:DUF1173 family protein [Bacillus velezensis]|uniref:DUF1173 family protein n=1 Tax=Bacillus velezensis TaxID=492670 RepID=UPI001C119C44|nr:DUF1173 family protein [Bacillus velezensis]MBU5239890.1 DUF1173 family protein [Bacillus velezensis]
MDYFLKVKYFTGKSKTYSYETVLEEFSEEKRKAFLSELYQLYNQNKVSLECKCNHLEQVRMQINHRKGYSGKELYYFSTFPGDKEKHTPYCNFYGDSYSSLYNQNWITKEGELSVKFKNTDFVLNKQKRNRKSGNNRRKSEKKMIQDKIGMFGFLTHWITETWNGVNKYRFEQDIPFPTKIDFYKALVSKSKKIKIGRGLSLHNVLYRMGSLNRSYYIERDHKNCMFVILSYIDHEEIEDGFDGYLVHLDSIEDKEIKKFVCSKERWDIVVENQNLNPHCWVGGWVKNTGENTPPEFIDIAIVPSNSHGLWSESSYEIKFYDLLCQEKRFFQKPYSTKNYPEWNGMKPDAILLDTSPKTIIEVFGRSLSDEDYHARRDEKIKHFSKLENYNFWYWDAFRNKKIPNLPEKHSTTLTEGALRRST